MKDPLVSVIMPAYNAEKYIGLAIKSVLEQTYTNFELIVIEDCSSDNTLIEIGKFKDSRIRLYKNRQNLGIANSTNIGLEAARGKYIALLDDDDIAMPDRLEMQTEYLEEHMSIDILGGRTIDIDETGRIISYGSTPRNNPKLIKAVLLFSTLDFSNGTAMIRKDFIEKNRLRYENKCYGMQDYKFYIESSKLGNISAIDRFLLKYRRHDHNETIRSMERYGKERAETYSSFQEESLKKSGYILKREYLNIIKKAFSEINGHCDSMEEIELLFQALGEILCQGKSMNIDYYPELNFLCKKKFSEQLAKMDIFGACNLI